jgi:hypothetical protein
MKGCGAQLERMLGDGRARVVLVAPFIKQRVVHRLFDAINPAVDVSIYTRWRPEEVAAGVSDLEVYDEVHQRAGTRLFLCAELHAKYYRIDERVLVGSANLTSAALGWAPRSNLELLVGADWQADPFGEFESELALRSIPATVEIRDCVQRAASSLSIVIGSEDALSASSITSSSAWLPHTRHPEVLFRAYAGKSEELTSSGQEQTREDLAALAIPPGLAEGEFRLLVGSRLIQNPSVVALDGLLDRPRRFGELRDLLGRRVAQEGLDRDPSEVWQTLMRWLLLFLPERYACQTPRYSEVFSTGIRQTGVLSSDRGKRCGE